MVDRIAALTALAARKPGDAMVRYALGAEYKKRGDAAAALAAYAEAIRIDPDYTAAYVEAGEVHAAEGRPDAARQVWQNGIAAADRKGALRTRKHLERLLAALEPRHAAGGAEERALPSPMRARGPGHASRPQGLRPESS